jgi:superfamily II DNA/RNA helicase
VRALLLAPTRELAAQIAREAMRLTSGRRTRILLLTKARATQAQTCNEAAARLDRCESR